MIKEPLTAGTVKEKTKTGGQKITLLQLRCSFRGQMWVCVCSVWGSTTVVFDSAIKDHSSPRGNRLTYNYKKEEGQRRRLLHLEPSPCIMDDVYKLLSKSDKTRQLSASMCKSFSVGTIKEEAEEKEMVDKMKSRSGAWEKAMIWKWVLVLAHYRGESQCERCCFCIVSPGRNWSTVPSQTVILLFAS